MAGRGRRTAAVNVASAAEVEQARAAVDASLRDLNEAANAVVLRLSRIEHPVERAKAAMEVRKYTSGDLSSITDGLFRDAILEAYARGRSENGWYGYGALAEALGLSRARVQQITNGTWKKKSDADREKVEEIRASADQTRTVRRLAASGKTVDDIASETGLSAAAVEDLLR